MSEDTLRRLERWYESRSNDLWEHQYGVQIDTLDNPGWSVKIDLRDTPLEGASFREVSTERNDRDWVRCRLNESRFEGFGGAGNLEEILKEFLNWAESVER